MSNKSDAIRHNSATSDAITTVQMELALQNYFGGRRTISSRRININGGFQRSTSAVYFAPDRYRQVELEMRYTASQSTDVPEDMVFQTV